MVSVQIKYIFNLPELKAQLAISEKHGWKWTKHHNSLVATL